MTKTTAEIMRIRFALVLTALSASIVPSKAELLVGDDAMAALAAAGPSDIDLDTRDGAFSQWLLKDIRAFNSVGVSAHVDRVGADSKWAPSIFVSLRSDDDVFGVRIASYERRLPLTITIEHLSHNNMVGKVTLSKKLDLKESIRITLNWKPDGTASVAVGDSKLYGARMGGSAKMLSLVGSTGDARFDSFTVSRVADSPTAGTELAPPGSP